MNAAGNRFFRQSLFSAPELLVNYGCRPHLPCDLSLIAGPFIWEEEVDRALQSCPGSSLNAYALPNQDPELLELLAAREGVASDWIYLTPGADLGIEFLLRQVLGEGDDMAVLVPNFPRFGIVAATLEGVTAVGYPDEASLPLDAKLVVVCTPNNPTTEEIPADALRGLIDRRPDSLICIDGVFDWYGTYSLAEFCREFPNVILLKSFSKIGLAGLRLGYVVARPEHISALQMGLTPFGVPNLVQRIGLEVVRHLDRLPELKERVADAWPQIEQAFGPAARRACAVPFYLLQTIMEADLAQDLLAKEGISVVSCGHFEGMDPGLLRVAIGTGEQNSRLIETVHRLKMAAS